MTLGASMPVHSDRDAHGDYLIASIAELAAPQGAPLVGRTRARTRLEELGDAGPYRVWYVTPLSAGARPR